MKATSCSDLELIKQLHLGSEAALASMFHKYWQPLFVAAFNVLKDKDACEDIIQEIFVTIWDRHEELEIRSSLKAYLFSSMRYEVYRQIKAGNVREDIFDQIYLRLQAPIPDDNIEYKELLAKVNAIVDALPVRCREVYQLSREEQLSHKEIAERLQISPKTVENHITKALHHLRISLGGMATMQFLCLLIE